MPEISIRGIPFKHELAPAPLAETLERIRVSRAATKASAKKLELAVQLKDEEGRMEAQDWLLRSPEAVLTSAIAANRKLKPIKRRSLEKCLEVPQLLDFSKPFSEIVRVYPKPKKPTNFGDPIVYRMLHNHGHVHRTAQDLVMTVLGAYFVPRPFQFTHCGVRAAIAKTKTLIKAGYVHAVRLDIVDFYKSFSAEALIAGLPLPKEVVEHAVIGRHMKVVLEQGRKTAKYAPYLLSPHTMDNLQLQARQGIPLGAGSSPIVGMLCVSRLAWSPMPNVALLNYADDFQLLAQNAKALEMSIGKLTAAISELPGGHFKLAVKAEGSAETGIDFLGHNLRLVNGELKTRPTFANSEYLYWRLCELDVVIGKLTVGPGKHDYAKAIRCVAEQYALVTGWLAAFIECDDIETRWAQHLFCKVFESLAIVGLSVDKIGEYTEPWMGYNPTDYALGM